MNTIDLAKPGTEGTAIRCGFCYDRENGKHGEIKREWSWEWLQFIPVCRLHACADGMDAGPKREEE